MRICPLSELTADSFFISDISAIRQRPTYRHMDIHPRQYNGCISVISGECLYTWEGGRCHLKPGSALYLPLQSTHSFDVYTEEYMVARVDFTLTDRMGETILFSREPLPLFPQSPTVFGWLADQLAVHFMQNATPFAMSALLYQLFDQLIHPNERVPEGPLYRVLEYIHSHFTEEITGEQLQSLCYLSRAQMHRLFREETGYSPVQYRNKLRIDRAMMLLRRDICTPSEAANILGFESLHYFSRVFKQYTGISPREYKQSSNDIPSQ